ncbi:hypothetical protein GF389_01375 [Candidatus Dojkabacteria bacterium]|nr:hypothetical protein [Candidatus Dojkabacteria bacterium]
MKNTIKIIFSLVLVIIFLVFCGVFFVMMSFGSWLHTYRVFTQKSLVAEVEVSELKTDENEFEYFELIYRPKEQQSGLLTILTSNKPGVDEYDEAQRFTLYGDHFELGGEIVKFDDFWTLLNLENIYKVTRLEGDYTDAEIASDAAAGGLRTLHELNGGTDDYWRQLQKNEDNYEFLVDSVYGNFATKFVQDETRTYNLYVTEDGFILDEK